MIGGVPAEATALGFGCNLKFTGDTATADHVVPRALCENNPMPLLCIPGAIPNRPRYNELRQKLRAAITAKNDTENGQSWDLSASQITLTETAEWIEMERLCCPFLAFRLETKNEPGHRLTMTGPEGTADFLKKEFEN